MDANPSGVSLFDGSESRTAERPRVAPVGYLSAMSEVIVVEEAQTDIGRIQIGRRQPVGSHEWIHEILIDGSLLMSSISPVSERRLSTGALKLHGGESALRVLIGGLGLGYTAEAALEDSRVSQVQVVEKMDFIIDWMSRGLMPLSAQFGAETRLEIVQGDVYADLLGPANETYDLILVDVDHSPEDLLSEASTPFYTVEGQLLVAQHLRPGGILGVWSAFDNDDFSQVLETVYTNGHREELSWPDDEFPNSEYHNVLFFARAPL